MLPFKEYKITSPFGMRMHPIDKVMKFHRGIDLVTTPGNGPLYAFVAGEVTHAKQGVAGTGVASEMGIVVAIKDRKGYLHLYAHLSMATVKPGQKVERGQMIGRQGTTGSSTGNHLHYEVRKTSSPYFGWVATTDNVVEPTQYLIDFYEEEAKLAVKGKVFPDMPDNHWAYSAVASLKENGVLSGDTKGNFNGDQPLTRYELAVALAKFDKYQKGVK